MSESPSASRSLLLRSGSALVGLFWLYAVVHKLTGDGHGLLIMVHALAGWCWLGAIAASLIAAAGRARAAAAFGAALAVWALSWNLGAGRPEPAGTGPSVKIAVGNVLTHNPDAARIAAELVEADPDVMGIVELGPQTADAMEALTEGWVHRTQIPRTDNFGIGLYSRSPLTSHSTETVGLVPWVVAALELDGTQIEVVVVHTLPPIRGEYNRLWQTQIDWLIDRNRDGKPRVVAGDLNITRHNPTWKRLLAAGYRDGFALTGQPSRRTWTPFRAGPDLMRLDHVLVSEQVGVEQLELVRRNGSDHRGIVATLRLR